MKRGFARCSGDGYPSELGAQLDGQEDVAQEYEGHCSFNVLEQVHCWVRAGVNKQIPTAGSLELGLTLTCTIPRRRREKTRLCGSGGGKGTMRADSRQLEDVLVWGIRCCAEFVALHSPGTIDLRFFNRLLSFTRFTPPPI